MSQEDPPTAVIVLGFLAVGTLVVLSVIGVRACEIGDKATFERVGATQDRKNFEESEAYRAGLRRDFDELMLSYARAKSDDERGAVLAVLRHRVEGAPPDAVPDDVKRFLKDKEKPQ